MSASCSTTVGRAPTRASERRPITALLLLVSLLCVLLAGLGMALVLETAVWRYADTARLMLARWNDTAARLERFAGPAAAVVEAHLAGIDSAASNTTACEFPVDRLPDLGGLDAVGQAYLQLDGCPAVLISTATPRRIEASGDAGVQARLQALQDRDRWGGISAADGASSSGLAWFGPIADPATGVEVIAGARRLIDVEGHPRGLLIVTAERPSLAREPGSDNRALVFELLSPDRSIAFSSAEAPADPPDPPDDFLPLGSHGHSAKLGFTSSHVWLSLPSPDTEWLVLAHISYADIVALHRPQMLACASILTFSLLCLALFARALSARGARAVLKLGSETHAQSGESIFIDMPSLPEDLARADFGTTQQVTAPFEEGNTPVHLGR